jgi:hypothetical protein
MLRCLLVVALLSLAAVLLIAQDGPSQPVQGADPNAEHKRSVQTACNDMQKKFASNGFRTSPNFLSVCGQWLTRTTTLTEPREVPGVCRGYCQAQSNEILDYKGAPLSPADRAELLSLCIERCVKDGNAKLSGDSGAGLQQQRR